MAQNRRQFLVIETNMRTHFLFGSYFVEQIVASVQYQCHIDLFHLISTTWSIFVQKTITMLRTCRSALAQRATRSCRGLVPGQPLHVELSQPTPSRWSVGDSQPRPAAWFRWVDPGPTPLRPPIWRAPCPYWCAHASLRKLEAQLLPELHACSQI